MPSVWSAAAWPIDAPFYAVLTAAVLYHAGGRRRVSARRHGLERRGQALAFYLGLGCVVVALNTPLDPLAERLFAAHMAQHVLLLAAAPPLIVLAAPWARLWQPLPLGFRRPVARAVVRARPIRSLGRALGNPYAAWLLFDANLVVWHVPALYDATLRSAPIHELEHALFFGTALLFWAQVVESAPFRVRLDWLRRVAYVTSAMLVGWLLAVVLAFEPSPLYDVYASLRSRPGGFSALADQQLAAGVMWVPGSLAYTVAIVVFLYRWLEPERSGRRGPASLARATGGN